MRSAGGESPQNEPSRGFYWANLGTFRAFWTPFSYGFGQYFLTFFLSIFSGILDVIFSRNFSRNFTQPDPTTPPPRDHCPSSSPRSPFADGEEPSPEPPGAKEPAKHAKKPEKPEKPTEKDKKGVLSLSCYISVLLPIFLFLTSAFGVTWSLLATVLVKKGMGFALAWLNGTLCPKSLVQRLARRLRSGFSAHKRRGVSLPPPARALAIKKGHFFPCFTSKI